MGGEVVQDHVDRGAVGAGGAYRPEGNQSVRGALAAVVDAPQSVVADRVAAVEVGDAMGAVVGRRQPVGSALPGPAAACDGADSERAELVEREGAVGKAVQVLDPVELGVILRIG
ncbi:hypothetical protein GCM10020229_18610 [Kitasatospora albolonga]